MNKTIHVDSLFLVSNEHRHLLHNDYLISTYTKKLTAPFHQCAYPARIMCDLALYFYLEQTPIINPEQGMTHAIRQFIVTKTMQLTKLRLLKTNIQHNWRYSLLLASKIANLFIDIFLRVIYRTSGSFTALQKIYYEHEQHAASDVSSFEFEQSCRKIAVLEATVYQQMRDYIDEHAQYFEERLTDIIRSMDEHLLREKELTLSPYSRGNNR